MPNTWHATLHGFTSGEKQMLALMNTAGSYFFVSFPQVAPCKTESIGQKAEPGSRTTGKQTPWELGATTEPPLRQETKVLTAAPSCDSTSSKSCAHVKISGCTAREMGKVLSSPGWIEGTLEGPRLLCCGSHNWLFSDIPQGLRNLVDPQCTWLYGSSLPLWQEHGRAGGTHPASWSGDSTCHNAQSHV